MVEGRRRAWEPVVLEDSPDQGHQEPHRAFLQDAGSDREAEAVQRAKQAQQRKMDESAIKPTNGAKRSKCVNKRKALDKAL